MRSGFRDPSQFKFLRKFIIRNINFNCGEVKIIFPFLVQTIRMYSWKEAFKKFRKEIPWLISYKRISITSNNVTCSNFSMIISIKTFLSRVQKKNSFFDDNQCRFFLLVPQTMDQLSNYKFPVKVNAIKTSKMSSISVVHYKHICYA